MTRRLSPERRLDAGQQRDERQWWHDLVDVIFDAMPLIQTQEREWGRGYPSTTLGGGGGGGDATSSTERAALTQTQDPGSACTEWLLARFEARGHLITLADRARRLLPLTEADVKRATTRQNTVELCAECERPVTKGKRLDGSLLHNESPGTDEHGEPLPVCFWQAYRRRERSA